MTRKYTNLLAGAVSAAAVIAFGAGIVKVARTSKGISPAGLAVAETEHNFFPAGR